MSHHNDYALLTTISEAAEVEMIEFGPSCKIPNLAAKGVPESLPSRLHPIRDKYLEFCAVKRIISAWNDGTWIYLCGFRLPDEESKGAIITTDLRRAIINLHNATAIRCLGNLLELDINNLTLFEVWKGIIQSELVSDLESGLLNIFKEEDITGSGSDGMNIEGREQLLEYFGISIWNKDCKRRLVTKLAHIRRLGLRFH